MMRLAPATRISLGLVSLTISLLMLGKIIGFAPDRSRSVLESRKNLSESLAVQFSAAAEQANFDLIKETIVSIVERNDDIRSAALRDSKGALLAEAGDHMASWEPTEDGRSTATHIQIPIFNGQRRWATVEVSFTPLWLNNITSGFKNSYFSLILFVGFTGFAGYFLLIKKTLRELDPSAVIPNRVRAAFDVLEEGVLILDENELIVLANASFADLVGKDPLTLVGFRGSELGWKGYNSPHYVNKLPWLQVLNGAESKLGVRMVMERSGSAPLTFIVNAAPVLDGKGNRRGVLVTLDNITQLEDKNLELNQTVRKLQVTTEEVQAKNRELEFLANHDPLTHLLNRRSFNKSFYQVFEHAKKHSSELSCIMCDIDHFKSVNDRYGHLTGDNVIKMVAGLLHKYFRQEDLLGRYGGEEFCVVLPEIERQQAAKIADRVRKAIKDDSSSGVQVTMSFGVSSLQENTSEPDELTNQADKALYIAKESGRNRVVCWGDDELADFVNINVEKKPADNQKQTVDNRTEPLVEGTTHEEVQRLTVRLKEFEKLAKERAQKLKHYTAYDMHTGLPTRTLFYDRVSQALVRSRRYNNIVAVLSMSVEAVQRINETLGFEKGDQLFKEIGLRLTEVIRGVDTVAMLPDTSLIPTVGRLGQEEIGVLLTDLEEINAITWIVKRILNSFDSPFQVDGNDIFATTNIGISISPHDSDVPEVLMRNATAAKSHARKNLGDNQYYYYSESINAVSIKHLNLEKQLRRALENDEFILHYQPKILAETGKICGVEALIRWFHPDVGLIPPHEFIAIAEYSGMIAPIGDWVLSKACEQLAKWHARGYETCTMAVNFSNKQFRHRNLVQRVDEIIRQNNIKPELLTIEVTESGMMENITQSMEILKGLSELGVCIALDDFGTGYSSLGYLKNFPVTHVKIDRSFVADIETNNKDANLVKSIINMAHGLGIAVTAEGVENERQIEHLVGYGCNEMQGFFFSKPVPGIEIEKLLQFGVRQKCVV